jgi:restriction system protein
MGSTLPDYQSLMLPLMEFASDGREHSVRQAIDHLAERFGLSSEERRRLLQSGRQPVFENRVGWARTYLAQAGLLERSRRGYFRITARGVQVLRERPERLDVRFLERFAEFRGFRARHRGTPRREKVREAATPEEALEDAYQRLRGTVASELLELVKTESPAFFERLVVDLLLAMGYGGSREEAGKAIGGTGDEGIDGVISEDRLGLDVIYIQAKRWDRPVGRPEIQRFVGALQGHRARKGVFITTSTFTKEAQEYGARIDRSLVLIDGPTLVDLMIEHDVGVSPVASYEVKKVDRDYFSEA